ncbi:MAG: hypothetical protein HJJLKODD_02774 [Phycisphaerae bacterium]|nr:hypothetical protein [Phycisphaerae bacterium]
MSTSTSNFNLQRRMYILMTVQLIGLVIFGFFAFDMIRIIRIKGPIYQDIVQSKDLIADVLPPPEYIIESYLVMFQMLHEKDPKQLHKLIERSAMLEKDYDTRHEYWQKDLDPGKMKDILLTDSYQPVVEFYRLQKEKFIPAIQAGNTALATELMNSTFKQLYDVHRTSIDAVVSMALERNQQDESRAQQIMSQRTLLLISLAVLITGFIIGFGIITIRGTMTRMQHVATTLNQGAEQVNDAAMQLQDASHKLAECATEQAGSLQNTLGALDEMSAMTQTSAENARNANDLASHAMQAAQQSDKTIVQLNTAMAEINTSSDKISKIIKVIEEIAFQTNLLALNAAVEAARAGEHGKGFAVVADEVRNLAQRAAQAARETTSLIEDSVNKAAEGSQVAQSVAKVLAQIISDVTRMTQLIDGIARATDEQAQGVAQINQAVSQIDQSTQSNAAGAEETSAAAAEMNTQAQAVKATVNELVHLIAG